MVYQASLPYPPRDHPMTGPRSVCYALVYSPDDEAECGKGYYWEDQVSDTWRQSQLFATIEDAEKAFRNQTLYWQ